MMKEICLFSGISFRGDAALAKTSIPKMHFKSCHLLEMPDTTTGGGGGPMPLNGICRDAL